jgi:beta-glucosidase
MNHKFLWGVATSAYQIEGAYNEDGKGLSIWDVYTKEDGKIFQNHNGDIACDHYHRFESDIELLKELGVNAYRFSVSWPRVLPQGAGKVNQKGLDFYNKIIDLLLKADIEPFVTLYHWDLPYELHLKGGFLNNDFSDWFYEYADTISKAFQDRVKFFATFNEPQCVIGGYGTGDFAPRYKVLKLERLRAVHNLLLAHAKAVKAIKSHNNDAKVGLVTCGSAFYPVTANKDNIKVLTQAYQSQYDESSILIYTDPIFWGKYPEKCYSNYPDFYQNINPDDLKLISEPVDYLGINNYEGVPVISDGPNGFKEIQRYDGYPKTDTGWAVEEDGIYWMGRFLYERYQKPIYITENGMANNDWAHLDGRVPDPARIDYLRRHIGKVRQAIKDGVDIRGYFVWSFLDNFEWASGYSKRFGLVHIDYRTQKRTPKDSFYWYRDFIESLKNS